MNAPLKTIRKIALSTNEQVRGAARFAWERVQALNPIHSDSQDTEEVDKSVESYSSEKRDSPFARTRDDPQREGPPIRGKTQSDQQEQDAQDFPSFSQELEQKAQDFESEKEQQEQKEEERIDTEIQARSQQPKEGEQNSQAFQSVHQEIEESLLTAQGFDETSFEEEESYEYTFDEDEFDEDEFDEDEFDEDEFDEDEFDEQKFREELRADAEESQKAQASYENGRDKSASQDADQVVQRTVRTLFDEPRPVQQFRAVFSEDGRQQDARFLTLSAGAWDEKSFHAEPDVLLDVPNLTVDELCLEVENLKAQVSLHAEVKNLVTIDVGANVEIEEVELDLKGVQAQAVLKVRLDEVRGILNRALETLDENPEIAAGLLQSVKDAAENIRTTTQEALSEDGAVDSATDTVKETTEKITSKPKQAAQKISETARSWVGSANDTAKEAGPSIQTASRSEHEDL